MKINALDRPVWSALSDHHKHLGQSYGRARRYLYDIEPFVVSEDRSPDAIADMVHLIEPGEEASLVEPEPFLPPEGVTGQTRSITQLVCAGIRPKQRDIPFRELGASDAAQMYDLAHLTKPGPFRRQTHTIGRFMGVFDGDRLVAMGGERMTFGDYTEISGVCTHPDYRGRGYGAALISVLGQRLEKEGQTPFLHSNSDNEIAMGLYQSLGFRPRRELWHCMWTRPAADKQRAA
ncbi:GNAT family N-acetyltransferase [Ponticaulis sp.]|uniref:GNAT family N-acetyltransferase n=1 Tax=Ponticaulis sp. TaxID=2020902 RepID=UPI000B6B8C00|nr:GNAT family N-acetyltransferase [Ponticaulis sp.]MAI90184.1 GNAT family N-acetyltransferase [Ponticaulis sp.]OUX99833.1 MAG: hypothetical protein CBB65_07065 [Hyphomonadaceae bacterium TMED5]|tara:strand:+ start:146568 stop:147269 length:702 start_codon:yes stop_codon:yes gene_type:complete